jgi:tyrosinase
MGLRKNYRSLTDNEPDNFVNALKALKQNGVVDQFAQIHAKNFDAGIHGTSHFLPWHREMLYRFERALQKVDSSVTIPYWDSSFDNNKSDSLFWTRDKFLGQFNSAWNLRRALEAPGTHLPTVQQVQDTLQNNSTYDTFSRRLEVDIHNPPHQWVGGEMGSVTSPHDPAFYLHHCWIDREWAIWQRRNPKAPFVQFGGPINWRSFGLNEPLLEWNDPARTPADVLDYRKLDYRYDTDDDLLAGEVLYPNNYQFSSLGSYTIWFDTNGRLLYQIPRGATLWVSGDPTSGSSRCVMRDDGNLVIYHTSAGPYDPNPIWESRTYANPGSRLKIEDGQLAIYPPNVDTPVWSKPDKPTAPTG